VLSYSSLREIQKREMESATIVKLEEDFYKQVADLLAKKKDEAMSSKSIMQIREFENIRKTIVSIQAKREEKIVLLALRGNNEGNGLTPEEKDFLQRFIGDISEMRNTVKDLWNTEETTRDSNIRRIRITKDVEKYTGLDKNIYGPFKIGEMQTLPKEEAEWLLQANMAEKI